MLKTYWGYSAFRPLQLETINAVLGGRDALVVMATGSGKSIWCAAYCLPAWRCLPHVSVQELTETLVLKFLFILAATSSRHLCQARWQSLSLR